MSASPKDGARKGRGAVSNPTGRYEPAKRTSFDDGWGSADDGAEPAPLATTVHTDQAKTIITTNDSPDLCFSQSANPYRGCEHGCVYCFARQSHPYLGLSAGLDFETQLYAKPNAAQLLRAELGKRGYRCQVLAMGTNTDPYQPIEREQRITRGILEVLAELSHPVGIVTKSALIARDVDLLAAMAKKNLASVFISLTTLNHDLAATLEPRAARPRRRLQTMRTLADAGIPVGVLTSPMIPGLNDHELDHLLEAAYAHGARRAGYALIRLPHEVKDLFVEWLNTHVPDRANKVLSLIRQAHDGQLYRAEFGVRARGTGAYAELLEQRFRLACKRLGFGEREDEGLDTTQFTPPVTTRQLPLFR